MKILLALIFNCAVFNSFAQFGTQGQKVLGGTITFNAGSSSTSSMPDIKPSDYNIGGSISVGKFTKKNTLKALSVFYIHGYGKSSGVNNVNRNYLNAASISYGVTKYKEIAKKLFFGIGGSAYATYNNAKYYDFNLIKAGHANSIGGGVYFFPIISYQINNRFVVNLAGSSQFLNIGYGVSTAETYSPNQPTIKSQLKRFNLETGFFGSELKNLTFGFNYLLKNKGK